MFLFIGFALGGCHPPDPPPRLGGLPPPRLPGWWRVAALYFSNRFPGWRTPTGPPKSGEFTKSTKLEFTLRLSSVISNYKLDIKLIVSYKNKSIIVNMLMLGPVIDFWDK